jgi:tetratricopeptide (TPR) repeat protein
VTNDANKDAVQPGNATVAADHGTAPLGSLMGGGALPRRDLEGEALAAARAALDAVRPPAAADEPALARRAGPREWLLRGLLALNLVLMVAMLFVPGAARPVETGGERVAPAEAPAPGHAPFVTPRQDRVSPIPDRELYNAALVQAENGEFEAAVATLERYLAQNPKLPAAVRQLVYLAMSYYLGRAGRMEDADRFEHMARALHARTSLPEDLLASAQRAEQEGRAADMRAAYARFLLLQRTIRPDLRRHVAEAYLKLGDSYRQEAEQAEQRAQEAERAQERERRRLPGGDGRK